VDLAVESGYPGNRKTEEGVTMVMTLTTKLALTERRFSEENRAHARASCLSLTIEFMDNDRYASYHDARSWPKPIEGLL
jgi:hypothetical protein